MAVVDIIVVLVYITVEFNMACELTSTYDKYVFESLEDVCELIVHFCSGKAIQEELPLMASTSSGKELNSRFFWGNGKKGSWVNYENNFDDNVGEAVNLQQVVAIAYSLCNFIWPSYAELSRSIEELIMYHLQPGDEVDGGGGGVEEVLLLKDSADGKAYLRRVYLALHDQGMISANELSGFFGCHQQCLYGCMCFCLLVFAMYHGGDRANMSSIDWVNHIVLSSGCAKVLVD